MPVQFNYRLKGTITLQNTGQVTASVYVGLVIEENDVLGRIRRGTITPVQVTLNPGESKTVTLEGTMSLRSNLKHTGTFVIATDPDLRNVLTTALADFLPYNPFINRIGLSVSQSDTSVLAGVNNNSNFVGTFYVGLTLATGISGSGCDLSASGSSKDYPFAQVTIYPGGSGTVKFNLSQADLSTYKYAIVKVWADDPTKYDSRVAQRLCLTGQAIQLASVVYNAQILDLGISGGKIYVRVKNTGNTGKYYWVGVTVIEAGKYSGSGCNIWVTGGNYWDIPPKSIGLQPGQDGTVYFDLPNLPPGNYQFIAKVWYDYDRNLNKMIAPCYDGKVSGTFTVSAQLSTSGASITAQPY